MPKNPSLPHEEQSIIDQFPLPERHLASRRKGSHQISQCGVVALAKGGAIACKRRLALTNLMTSGMYTLFVTAH